MKKVDPVEADILKGDDDEASVSDLNSNIDSEDEDDGNIDNDDDEGYGEKIQKILSASASASAEGDVQSSTIATSVISGINDSDCISIITKNTTETFIPMPDGHSIVYTPQPFTVLPWLGSANWYVMYLAHKLTHRIFPR